MSQVTAGDQNFLVLTAMDAGSGKLGSIAVNAFDKATLMLMYDGS